MTQREIRLQGLGGQGIITAGRLLGEAASLRERREAVMTEDYSPYITGGWSRADLIISDEPIDYPLVTKPDILVAMSQDGFDDNWKSTTPNATIIVEQGIVNTCPVEGRKLFAVPALATAEGLGKRVVANIVILGFLAAKTAVVSREALEGAILARYAKAADLNRRAFQKGVEFASQSVEGSQTEEEVSYLRT
jgi:2-oxoglutarate ferredoxin oxidoreductase subunit gamma